MIKKKLFNKLLSGSKNIKFSEVTAGEHSQIVVKFFFGVQ
jgi:hypothetical protein